MKGVNGNDPVIFAYNDDNITPKGHKIGMGHRHATIV